MTKNLPGFIILLFFLFQNSPFLFGQSVTLQTDTIRRNSLKLFVDCSSCDQDYYREQLTFVNFVRETREAHVHLLVTFENTGAGGLKYSLLFIGQKQFKGQNDTLSFVSKQDASPDEIREGQLKAIKLGLIRFVAKFPISDYINIAYDKPKKQDIVEDKWNSWVFEIDFGGYYTGEESYTSTSLWSALSAQKITPDWKFQFEAGNNYEENHYKIDTFTYISINRGDYFIHRAVKSISNHWSVGEGVTISTATFSNNRLFYSIYPLIEYNLFPYSESTRKQLRILYGIGYEHSDYQDTTLYNKIEEDIFGQKLMISFGMKHKWGSLAFSARSFNVMNDFKKNNIRLNSSVNLRVFKGFSVKLEGSMAWLHDQLYLPKGTIPYEQILLKQKQLRTQYTYSFQFSLNYSFGSIYNNVVNPRISGYY